MTTKDVVEAILYLNPETEKFFRACHLLDDNRAWKPYAHPEYPFIDAFKDPRFLVIISTQIHIYLIGTESDKKRSYHIINIEGFHADHMICSKSELTTTIKKVVTEKLFLPRNFYDRIIYMYHEGLFIFNKVNDKGNLFSKNAEWSMGVDIYSADARTYKTTANDILKAIYGEF
jgi:hypothetical protein